MFLIDLNRLPTPDLWSSHIFHMPYAFVWFPYDLVIVGSEFNRQPSPDLRFSYSCLWFVLFSYGFAMFFVVALNRLPSLDLQLSYVLPMVFLYLCNVFS